MQAHGRLPFRNECLILIYASTQGHTGHSGQISLFLTPSGLYAKITHMNLQVRTDSVRFSVQ